MRSEWDKCNFCKNYDICAAFDDWYCDNGSDFVLSQDRVIEMAEQKGISYTDVLALIER